MQKFTPEDLLEYLYKDISLEKKLSIEFALESDWTLREKLAVLKTAQERLNSITVSPRTEIILNVLNYARKTSVSEVK